ncbi:MAG: helix-turn-helix domain-containing protein [Deltaproteobacteria bacterium]|jgi:transcriptional regulator with XRE-family HTH domain|nr:helix-turn-helix domain-containing protein [Deltaproteobacteria bacterium]
MTFDNFGERLAQRRKELGFEQSDLAKASGVSRASISHYEKGLYEPKLGVLVLLSRKLSCSTDWLLGSDSSPVPPNTKVPAWILPLCSKLEKIKSRAGRNSVKIFIDTIAHTKASH